MAAKSQERQRLIRLYKQETGKTEVDMHDVAKFAISMGWPLPVPKSPLDRLAEEFSRAAREEIRHDPKTGHPYRVNHVYTQTQGDTQLHLWIDIDEAPRGPMHKSLMLRRRQMLGDGLQLTFDADHWNAMHPDEEPINVPMDFTDDIEEEKNIPDEIEKAG